MQPHRARTALDIFGDALQPVDEPARAEAPLPRQPFPAEIPEDAFPNRITAKLAIADDLARPLVKLDPEDRAFIDQLLAETLVRHIVLARVREHFRTQNLPGDHHAR